ncbi:MULTISPECIES: head completion/stabilization protein [unclassified Moraxella]|uniref:head completion/stabilization protein n=1 Tax=unclassified Moraxella TaxID=2685852 RepID=UPI00359E749B
MSLIANGELSTALSQIDGGEFFPSVSVADVRDFVRVDGSVTDARLHQIILEETLDVMRLLDPLTKKAGRLTDLSTVFIDGKNAFEVWYFSAVANGVGAKVCEKYRNYDSTNKGNDKAAELSATIDEYRRNKMWALAQMQGRNQTVVELI